MYNLLFPNSGRSGNIPVESARLRQEEARTMLRKAYQKQQIYFGRYGRYSWYFDSLGIDDKGTYYEMEITDAQRTYFCIKATANIDDDPTIDMWIITNNGKPDHRIDDAER